MAELRQQELTGPPAVVFYICGSPFTLSFVSLFCCSGLSSPCAFWLTHLRHTSDFRSRMLPFRDLIPASTVIACSLVLYGAGQSWKEVPFFYKWLCSGNFLGGFLFPVSAEVPGSPVWEASGIWLILSTCLGISTAWIASSLTCLAIKRK